MVKLGCIIQVRISVSFVDSFVVALVLTTTDMSANEWLLTLEKTIRPDSNEVQIIVPEICYPFFVWENGNTTAKVAVDSLSLTLLVETTENGQFQLTIEKEKWNKFKEITSKIFKNHADLIPEKWKIFFECEMAHPNSFRFHLRSFGPDDEQMFVNNIYKIEKRSH